MSTYYNFNRLAVKIISCILRFTAEWWEESKRFFGWIYAGDGRNPTI